MERRQLGRSELRVSPLCFGCNVFGWTVDEATSFRLLDALVDAGMNFIDTADVYSRWKQGNRGGESEAIIGNWLKSRDGREKLVIATKVGNDMGLGRKSLAKTYIRSAVETSLKRLRTDYIDLYQSHIDDPDTPLQETLEAYQELIEAGKVRAIGASNYSATRLREALELSIMARLPRYEALQPEYNLYERAKYEAELEPLCRNHQVSTISYFSLASGFLTGKYRSERDFGKSVRGQGMAKYLNSRGHRILAALDEIAAEHRATPAQVALAWLMTRPGVTAPIASATSLEQLTELVGAARLSLGPGSIERLDQASS